MFLNVKINKKEQKLTVNVIKYQAFSLFLSKVTINKTKIISIKYVLFICYIHTYNLHY